MQYSRFCLLATFAHYLATSSKGSLTEKHAQLPNTTNRIDGVRGDRPPGGGCGDNIVPTKNHYKEWSISSAKPSTGH
jgi:hypothetical protein